MSITDWILNSLASYHAENCFQISAILVFLDCRFVKSWNWINALSADFCTDLILLSFNIYYYEKTDTKVVPQLYSGDLETLHVWFLIGTKMVRCQMVWFRDPIQWLDHLSGFWMVCIVMLTRLVFKCHLNTGHPYHLNTGQIDAILCTGPVFK